ncbi:MAG: M1 family metallopeptidase [Acidobacteriota bacterium]|nr:M1 family metallopeptidase [Acidobacteriota bacterium]
MLTLGLLTMFAYSFKDIHTFGNTDEVLTERLSLDLTLDFEKKVIHGSCEITLAYQTDKDKVDYVDLDISRLDIESVTANGKALTYYIGKHTADMGSRLHIMLPADKPDKIRIEYRTHPGAEAVQWLSKEQTTSKKFPYLFTQGQSIFTRTWIPCMDSPGVRVAYDAVIRVPKGMTAVMSAYHQQHDAAEGIFRFDMDIPIPPYLIALAAGEIAFKKISDRAGVYAEPAVVEKAAWEFADMEKMIQVAEKLYGDYRWKRWDAIVLPPSFPFGGMENPMLTFATPTLIAGDRSLVNTMAHELAHSWSGNLVTNATWSDFWLNEGFTTYFERRIMEELYGKEIAEMDNLLAQRDLIEDVETMNKSEHPGDSILYIDLKGRHPDDGFSGIPYDKGANFLLLLETTFGRERFDAWLKNYFDTWAFKTMTTDHMLRLMKRDLFKGDDAMWRKLRVEEWVYEKGIPDNMVIPESDKFEKTRAAAKTFIKSGKTDGVKKDWVTAEWLDFLNSLPEQVSRERMEALDKQFKLTDAGNSEILFAWGMVAVRNNYEPAYDAIRDFLTRMGRRKFLSPLYRAMNENPKTQKMARDIYKNARSGYHPIAQASIDKILGR